MAAVILGSVLGTRTKINPTGKISGIFLTLEADNN
jgi:hypothetical protein